MEFIRYVFGALLSGGILTFILALFQRKWAKEDKKEDKEDAVKRIEEKLDKFIESEKEREERQEDITNQLVEQVAKHTKAIRLYMLERLRYLGLCYLNSPDRKIDIDDKEQWRNMHEAYEDIGGNGDLDTIKDEIEKRETKINEQI